LRQDIQRPRTEFQAGVGLGDALASHAAMLADWRVEGGHARFRTSLESRPRLLRCTGAAPAMLSCDGCRGLPRKPLPFTAANISHTEEEECRFPWDNPLRSSL
jgi:hypothetical protein